MTKRRMQFYDSFKYICVSSMKLYKNYIIRFHNVNQFYKVLNKMYHPKLSSLEINKLGRGMNYCIDRPIACYDIMTLRKPIF